VRKPETDSEQGDANSRLLLYLQDHLGSSPECPSTMPFFKLRG